MAAAGVYGSICSSQHHQCLALPSGIDPDLRRPAAHAALCFVAQCAGVSEPARKHAKWASPAGEIMALGQLDLCRERDNEGVVESVVG